MPICTGTLYIAHCMSSLSHLDACSFYFVVKINLKCNKLEGFFCYQSPMVTVRIQLSLMSTKSNRYFSVARMFYTPNEVTDRKGE